MRLEFDNDTLAEAMKKTFENRNHHFTIEQYKQVLSFGDNDAMLKKWNAFVKKTKLQFVDYQIVIETIDSKIGNTITYLLKG